jgi:hypothetical protein
MERLPHNRTYALAAAATTVSLAETIDMSNFAGGSYEVTGAQTITFFGTNQDDPVGKTFVKCEDEDGIDVPAATHTAAGIRALPSSCYNYRYICLVDSNGGNVYLHIKS